MQHDFHGGCYCGNISVQFQSDLPLEELKPRACTCGFCAQSGAAWLSDPNGQINLAITNEAALSLYAQGSQTAKFWICQRCGTISAVTTEIKGTLHGAVNARCLEDFERFGAPVPVSPSDLPDQSKVKRWEALWTKHIVVKEAWDVGL